MDIFQRSTPSAGNDQAGSVPDAPTIPTFTSMLGAALFWDCAGFEVLPLIEGTKRPAGPWRRHFRKPHTEASIRALWGPQSRYGLGAVVGDRVVILDADSPAAVARLHTVEKATGLSPGFVVDSSRGEHHYFGRRPGMHLTSRCFSTKAFPEHIDLLTGEHVVELPPSGGKRITTICGSSFTNINDLPLITEALLAQLHPETRPPVTARTGVDIETTCELTPVILAQILACLEVLDPDLSYPDWYRVGAAIFNSTGGSPAGFELFDRWSSTGRKYKGVSDTGKLWASLSPDHPRPITLGTLRYLVTSAGHDWVDVCAHTEADFDRTEGEAV